MLLRLAEDNFDAYADDASLTSVASSWTVVCGRLGVSSGAVHPNWDGASSPAGLGAAYWNACAFPDDQYAEAAVTPFEPPWSYVGLAVRCAPAAVTYYQALVITDGGLQIRKVIDGVTTTISAAPQMAIAAGTVCRLEAIGNTLSFYVDGVAVIGAVDDEITSGSPGICSFGPSYPSNQPTLDEWHGGEIGTGVEGNEPAPNTRVRARHGGR